MPNHRNTFSKAILSLLAVILALFTSPAVAQTPDPQPGIWSGTVITKKTYVALAHTKTATLSISGFVGDPNNLEGFSGVILNLDNMGSFKPAELQTIGLNLKGLVEGSLVQTPAGEGPLAIQPKTLKFVTSRTTNKMTSLSFKAKGNVESPFPSTAVLMEYSLNLTWKKALPSS